MNLKNLVQLVIDNTDGYESFPFNKDNSHEKIVWHVIKHESNNKIIALVFEKDDELLIDLKLTIEHGQQMRLLRGVGAGYHMNKEHWNTVHVNDTDVSESELINMIKESSDLTS
ncbi:putative DNA-binding protein (MmcQ/YjbR family) [Weissella uvarum]|uniref:MmcQ/YjbR family DNA-binding protein n=1 Tax=Weissella uvarum TaxID=1479233 RepID=UPI00195F6A01|nr:MmcQ/YjbR family DNA-binding protein [Weissella uvarum]MBM7616606.1 putative DNA-binding protein (MmcQ/YjbR family) [Weissella uvarum]MCM0594936.1 MmcQ/YjbR family DNA-binding protein [Weissella uvarum]